ncbi:MAG: LegC family aminotransferase [Verrucomicrobia bacterium]|nr:LegC family aminotransferase [Verrucomicrobiota bacterium]
MPRLADDFVAFVRPLLGSVEPVPLHAPQFAGREKDYVLEAINSTFVSSVGGFVDRFEAAVAQYTGARHAVATVNGTAALHTALMLVGTAPGDEVITQPVTFVATANAIRYCGAEPVFVDVERETLGLSPEKLERFLRAHATPGGGGCVNKTTGRTLRACVPVHTLGHPARTGALREICDRFGLALVEDAAEALGSFRDGCHTGRSGQVGIFSFNGNKTITTGGGGMLVTNDPSLAERAKHLTTTGKLPHPWAYVHDVVGYNYRMPNLNAALGCAQLERLPAILQSKRRLATAYARFFEGKGVTLLREPPNCRSNYWLNAVILRDEQQRDDFLRRTHDGGVRTRPLWEPLHRLSMFRQCQADDLEEATWICQRLVTIPSGVKWSGEETR